MAFALVARKTGTDGSQESDWLKSFRNHHDEAQRRAELQSLINQQADPSAWEVVEITTAEEYKAVHAVAYASVYAAEQAAYVELRDNYRAFRRKFATLFRSSQVTNILTSNGETAFTIDELRAFEQVIMNDVPDNARG